MRITGFPAGMFGTNCYIVADENGDCVIVDPGQDAAPEVRARIEEAGLTPKAVLLTHGHLDHVWNAREVADHYGVPAYIHPDDREMLTDPAKALSIDLASMLGDRTFTEPAEVVELFDGDHLEFGDLVFDVDPAAAPAGSYPIALVSYLIACEQYEDQNTAELVKAYFEYVASEEGQQAAADNAGSAPISEGLREKVLAAIDTIKVG